MWVINRFKREQITMNEQKLQNKKTINSIYIFKKNLPKFLFLYVFADKGQKRIFQDLEKKGGNKKRSI